MVPTAGQDYPASYAELLAGFRSDDDCLGWLRWREGLSCLACG